MVRGEIVFLSFLLDKNKRLELTLEATTTELTIKFLNESSLRLSEMITLSV
jgi:hypothetical protein